jgi:hypothetical protein
LAAATPDTPIASEAAANARAMRNRVFRSIPVSSID